MIAFRDLFSRHVATSFARQLALGDFLGEHNWGVDIDAGTVDFGNGRIFPIQLLGSESDSQQTWLWAWANTQSNLPPAILQDCDRMQAFGEEHELPELTDASFSLSVADGHMLSLLCVGLIGDCCYYRGPYDGGALYFMIANLPESLLTPVSLPRAITTIGQVISSFDVDHRLMAESFLAAQGFTFEKSELLIQAIRERGEELAIEFDGSGRIIKFNADVKPKSS